MDEMNIQPVDFSDELRQGDELRCLQRLRPNARAMKNLSDMITIPEAG
jgi:hypothetical protein